MRKILHYGEDGLYISLGGQSQRYRMSQSNLLSVLHELLEVEDGGRGHGGAVADAEPS